MLVVSPSSVATSPPVMSNLPILRLYDLLGCSVGDMFIVLCLKPGGEFFFPEEFRPSHYLVW